LWDWLTARSWKGIVVAIVATILFGAVGFMIFGQMGPIEGLYMAVITVSTVGFGDSSAPDNIPGRLFTTAYVILGVGVVSLSISRVAAAMVEGRIREALGSRRMQQRIQTLRNHVILCGYGRFGQITAREIHESGIPVVVIDTDADVLEDAEEDGLLVMNADATEEETLELAGIKHARTLLCTLPSDADNVYTILTARDVCRDVNIVALARDRRAESKLKVAGAAHVVSPYAIGARYMARQIIAPHVAQVVGMATAGGAASQTGGVMMEEVPVSAHSPIANMKLRESPIRSKYGVMVVAIIKGGGERHFNPDPDIALEPGDVLVCVGQAGNLVRLQTAMVKAEQESMSMDGPASGP